jgi:iron complex outermembrane recepter protein
MTDTRHYGLQRAIRRALTGAIGCSVVFGPSVVLAQQQTGTDQKPLEEIYVTGSRIARSSDLDSPSPVVSFNAEEINKSGYTNLQQLLEKQPFVSAGTFSTRGNNQDSSANGTAGVSLRGLGADATLVLVNGRRVAISAFAEGITTNFVDINTIPVAAIERIEVLKDGASAVYGSDAVAGVINVILKKNYQGLEISGSYGATSDSAYDEKNGSLIWGFGDDDSNVTMIFDYFKNSTLMNKERGSLGTANQEPRGGVDNRSSRGFPGSFDVTTVAGGTAVTTRVDPTCPLDRTGSTSCVYDYGPWNLLTPEAERTGAMLLGHQKFGDNVELFTELGIQHNTSIAQGAPTPLDTSAGLTVPITHPNNPWTDVTSIAIRRFRTVDAGPRGWNIETDNLRGVLGLRGSFNDWNWEVAAQRARSESDQTGSRKQGWVRTDYLQQQIDAGLYNPFGTTYNSPEVIDAITTSLVRQGTSQLTAYNAQVDGSLMDLPAGKLGLAAGAEYREEAIKDQPDEQFRRGLIFGTEAVAAAASRDIWSAYVEFNVPIITTLSLDAALRYDHYSDFGSTTNPKLAARWTPIESLAFRASWGTGFRAPSLAQVGLGPSQDSSFFADVPGCAVNPAYCDNTDYTVTYTGNPNLKAEESESYNVGVQWKPTTSLQFALDYWDIKQDHKIDKTLPGPIVANFCTTQASTVCERADPRPGDALGELLNVNATFDNVGEQHVNGVDLAAYTNWDLGPGSLAVNLDYTRTLEFERALPLADGTGFKSRDVVGKYEYPEDRAVLTGDWSMQSWGLNATVNYIGSFADLNGSPDYFDSTRDVSSWTTLNLQARYTGFQGLTVALGVDNAFDESPPFAIGDSDTDLYGYVSGVHDPRGRFVYGKLTYKF